MSDHEVTATWDPNGSVGYRFTCNAPAESLCHALYACTCESWNDERVVDGNPVHTVGDDDPADIETIRHFGTFDPDECRYRDWFENSDECLRGSVTFPVRGEFDGDWMTFYAEESK